MRAEYDIAARQLSAVEKELWAAFGSLKLKSVDGRAARISFSAVAVEAGRSRTLIGHDDCPYPDLRKAIQDAIAAQRRQNEYRKRGKSRGRSVILVQEPYGSPSRQAKTSDSHSEATGLKDIVTSLEERIKEAAIKIVTIDDENQQLREEVKRLKTELTRKR